MGKNNKIDKEELLESIKKTIKLIEKKKEREKKESLNRDLGDYLMV